MKNIVIAIALALATVCSIPAARSQANDYPTRSITIIVPFPVGGGSDMIARLLANHLREAWKQNVVVENRTGANGVIGATAVAKAEPDGYTLLFTAPSLTTMKAILKSPPLDAEKDFEPVSQIIASPYLVAVNSDLPVTSMKGFLEYAKANPGKLSYGTIGGSGAFALELFKQRAGISMVAVNYRGSSPLVNALGQGEVQFGFDAVITLDPLIKSGKVKALAVSTLQRMATLPDLPTIAESGLAGYEASFWFGLFAPAKTSTSIIAKLALEAGRFVKTPEVRARLQGLGYIPIGSSPEYFRELVRKEVAQWDKISTEMKYERQ